MITGSVHAAAQQTRSTRNLSRKEDSWFSAEKLPLFQAYWGLNNASLPLSVAAGIYVSLKWLCGQGFSNLKPSNSRII